MKYFLNYLKEVNDLIKAVLLDLDNTLYDEHEFVKSGFKAVAHQLADKFGLNEELFYSRLCNIFLEHGRKQVFTQVLNYFGIYTDVDLSYALEVYRKHPPRISVFKDVTDVLPVLKKKYRLGLITDGLRLVQENKVKALKIGGYFDATIYSSDYGSKCCPKPFSVILEKLQIKADESVYVDDNPNKGFAVAKELGIRTIRMLRGENMSILVSDQHVKPDKEISNLYQLEDRICEINRL